VGANWRRTLQPLEEYAVALCVALLLATSAALAAPLDVGSRKQVPNDGRFVEPPRGVRLVNTADGRLSRDDPQEGPSGIHPVNDSTSTRSHPLLFATTEEIDRARERAQRSNWARAAYDRIIARADQALAGQLAIPDKGGQWTHYYTCPKHGVGLKTESPTRHMCPVDGEVYRGWPYDDVAISHLHQKYNADLESLGLAFAFTHDPRYAERARAILLAYADKYPHYERHDIRGNDTASAGRRFAQTLDEAVALIRVVWAYDLVYDTIPSADRERIERDFLRPSVEVIQRHRAGKSNWQSWHNAAIGALGFCIGDQDLIGMALDDPQNGFHCQMRASVLSDGWWYEGAPSYHFYALSALIFLAEGAYRAGVNLYDARLKALFDAPFDLAYPDFTLPALNDSDRFSLIAQERLYEVAATRFRDKRYGAMLARGARGGFEALLWGPEQIDRAPELQATSVNLGGLGCAVLRDGVGADARCLLLDYGPHGGGHGHPEKLQILLYGAGRELAPDAGRLAYSVPLHRTWYRETLAHNTIVVDQKSQEPTEGKLALFHAGTDFQVARAVATGAYEGVALDRTVVMTRGYILDVFRAHSAGSHSYDWVYHNTGRVSSDLMAFESKKPLAKDAGYQHLGRLRRAEDPGAWAVEWQVDPTTGADGGARIRLVGADGCGPAEIFFADAPSQPPTERMPLVICRRRGEGAVFVTAIEVMPPQTGETARQPLVQSVTLTGWVGPPGARGLSITVMTANGPDSFWIADDPEASGAQVVYVPTRGDKRTAP
jgi:hypothetical protein